MQIENVYLVEYNNQTIGVWNSLESAKTFIMGCHQNGLMISFANIKTYKINTFFCFETETVNISNIKLEKSKINDEKSKLNENQVKSTYKIDPKDPVYIEMTKQKTELQHKINMLKQQKKKIENSKTTYINDYKLFELFTESKQRDPTFIIPEIFTRKFNLMTVLQNENKLSWENFVKEFQHENVYNEYFGLNSYEEMFLESDDKDKNDISEEVDIEV